MNIQIRSERDGELPVILEMVRQAFAQTAESDHREHLLVERLHRDEAFIPELSLVATTDDGLAVGYILLTKADIVTDAGDVCPTLAVAPLAVLPYFQRLGIGGKLLRHAHSVAARLGYGTAILLGHKDYYPRFGYQKAIGAGIRFPFDVPEDYCMVIELLPHALRNCCGMVGYARAFSAE